MSGLKRGEMRLSGHGLRCVRGGREVFAGLEFAAASGEAVAVTGRNGSGKTSLLRLIAGLLVPAGRAIALDRGDAELTVPEQCHYLGHRDALKPALSVAENLVFWADFLGGSAVTRLNASPPSASTMPPICPPPSSPPASAAACRWPGC